MLPCHGCAYRKEIPGNCHIQCEFDWTQEPLFLIRLVDNCPERASQWFFFPFNYDPVWGLDECPGRAENKDSTKVAIYSPLTQLLSLLK